MTSKSKLAIRGLLIFPTFAALACYGEAYAQERARLIAVPWYVVSLDANALGVHIDDTIIFSSVQIDGNGQRIFWMAERRNLRTSLANRNAAPVHQWIDGRNCEALTGVLARASTASKLLMVGANAHLRIAPPSEIGRVKLSAPAAGEAGLGGARVASSAFFGPLVDWWKQGSAAIEKCWTDQPVDLSGRSATVWLNDSSDAARWKAF